MAFRRTLLLSLSLGVMAPAVASADGMIVPFAGVNFGGKSGRELSDAIDAKRFDWGVSFAFMGAGVLGLEADIAHSPDFFGRSDIGGSSVLTATGNLLLGIPFGGQSGVGVRPYVLAGAGVIRTKVDVLGDVLSLNNSEAAWDFGGGVMLFFGDNIGLRGDLRYFRTFKSLDFGLLDILERRQHLDFARGSAGLILRF
jgi:Outer membrane protein beta-barrel domain